HPHLVTLPTLRPPSPGRYNRWGVPGRTKPMDLRRRVDRLLELEMGLAKEVPLWNGSDPLLRNERVAYLARIRDALAGVSAARVVLVKALIRIDCERR